MKKFAFSPEHRQAELDRVAERKLARQRLFVLLLGPSATGKTAIISQLYEQAGNTFEYVRPVMTRPNRPNETDKISVSDDIFRSMKERGEFVVVNHLYGVNYCTPLEGIVDPLRRGLTPILDYPLSAVEKLKRPELYDIMSFYIYPPSLDALRARIEASGRNSDGRLESGIAELSQLDMSGFVHPAIDVSVVNSENAAPEVARTILRVIQEVVVS